MTEHGRKTILKAGIILAIVSLTMVGVCAADTVLIHTNDVHGRFSDNIGYDGLSAFVQECRANGDDVILLDAGDGFQGLLQTNYFKGASTVDLMNQVGYTAAVPGNNDYTWGISHLKTLADSAKFSLVASNILSEETGEHVFQEYVIVESGGKKFGIFGIAYPYGYSDGVIFLNGEEMYAAAQKTADTLRSKGCDYVICLAHLGVNDNAEPDRSIDLARHITGVDVIIDGHSHTELPEGLIENNILIASAGSYLGAIGVVRINDSGISASLVKNYEKKDPVITAAINEYLAVVDEVYSEEIGRTTVLLNGERNPGVRTMETNLGDLVADALVQEAKNSGFDADAALVPCVLIRTSLQPGVLTAKDIVNVSPYDLELYQFQVPGTALLEIMEEATASVPEENNAFKQVSGIECTVDTSKEYVSGEINRVTINSVGGKPFDENATYSIISVSTLSYDLPAVSLNTTLSSMLAKYIAVTKNGTIGSEYAEPKENITVVEGTGSAVPKTPAPVVGILAGLTAALFLLKRKQH